MRKTKFQRITAFILAFLLLFCGSVNIAAAEGSVSVTDKTTSDIKALLNAISYKKYSEDNRDLLRCDRDISIVLTVLVVRNCIKQSFYITCRFVSDRY